MQPFAPRNIARTRVTLCDMVLPDLLTLALGPGCSLILQVFVTAQWHDQACNRTEYTSNMQLLHEHSKQHQTRTYEVTPSFLRLAGVRPSPASRQQARRAACDCYKLRQSAGVRSTRIVADSPRKHRVVEQPSREEAHHAEHFGLDARAVMSVRLGAADCMTERRDAL